MNLDNIFDEISFFVEAGIDSYNIEALKEIGNVTHIKKEVNGYITEYIDFTSFDNKISFSKSYSYKVEDKNSQRIKEIEEEMVAAIFTENYELAQKLKEEKEGL